MDNIYPVDTTEPAPHDLSNEDRPQAGLLFCGPRSPRLPVLLIQPWDADAMWETVAPHLSKALARQGEFRAEDIKQLCAGNVMQLWYVPGTHAVVTQIQDKPLCRTLMIVLCGGEGLEQAPAVIGVLEDYGRAMRCTEVRIQGRRGWGRVLGYETSETIMRKKL